MSIILSDQTLKHFFCSFVKRPSSFVRSILSGVVETAPTESQEPTLTSLPNPELSDFLSSAAKWPGGNIYTMKSTNTVH